MLDGTHNNSLWLGAYIIENVIDHGSRQAEESRTGEVPTGRIVYAGRRMQRSSGIS